MYIVRVVGIQYSIQGVKRKYTDKRILSILLEPKFAKTVYFRRPSINGKRKYTVYTLLYDSYIRTSDRSEYNTSRYQKKTFANKKMRIASGTKYSKLYVRRLDIILPYPSNF